jgi:putative transposase
VHPEVENPAPTEAIAVATSERMQERVEVIQELLGAADREEYRQRTQAAAERLNLSVSSIQRLVRAWKQQGVAGLSWRERSDRGQFRISEEWQKFIITTYRSGNRGSRRMSPAQAAVRVKVRAQEQGLASYPSHMSVYRILKPVIEKRQQGKRSLGWKGSRLSLPTRDGQEIGIEWSNQAWQCDHTRADVLVVDQSGALLGRPWLTIVVDSYSRCIMGMHLGFDAPSAAVVCLALRHAILPKQYSSAYELQQPWGTYGLPQNLYTDSGKDFRSQHLEQVCTELGIGVCLRRKPSDGGIVERPFGTFNTQFFSSLPGYVSSSIETRSTKAESEACLTLLQLEQLLVRYIVDHYNPSIDARMGDQSRIGRWEAGRIAPLRLLGERDLDLCLMRRDRRSVYRSGYLQFASLTYQGEHLAAYAGERVILRYNPRDITTLLVYQLQDSKEVFLTRAHAIGWETETLSYREAQALSQQRRQAVALIESASRLKEVRDRDQRIQQLQQAKKQPPMLTEPAKSQSATLPPREITLPPDPTLDVPAPPPPKKPVPYVRVVSPEQLEREGDLW